MPSPKHLIAICRSGGRRPLIMVHSLAGELTWLPVLSQELGRDRPLYGFAAPGLNCEAPFFSTLEAMATAYLHEVRMAQPQGPYLLGGYSFGGVVAFEMARQLQLEGEPVETLILMDAFAPRPRLNRLFTCWAGNGVLLQVVANLLGREWKARELLAAGILPSGDPAGQTDMAARHLLTQCSIPHSFEALKGYLDRCQAMMIVHVRMLAEYRPQPLPVPIRTLLCHNALGLVGLDNPLRLPVLPEPDRNPEHGWDPLLPTPPVRIEVPAEHFLIGVQPAISGVARAIGRAL
jgi:thioesterase domain-containing protein